MIYAPWPTKKTTVAHRLKNPDLGVYKIKIRAPVQVQKTKTVNGSRSNSVRRRGSNNNNNSNVFVECRPLCRKGKGNTSTSITNKKACVNG